MQITKLKKKWNRTVKRDEIMRKMCQYLAGGLTNENVSKSIKRIKREYYFRSTCVSMALLSWLSDE